MYIRTSSGSTRTALAYVAFALMAVLIVGLHTAHFHGRPYRQDEAWIVHGALERGGVAEMTQWVSTNIHPPLWIAVVNLWVDGLGQHESITRALSGLLTLVSLALLFRLGADLAGSPRSPIPLVAVLLLGTSTFFQFYTHELRPYPALAACALALCLTFLRWLRRPDFRHALLFVACGITALYVHFFSVYVLGALAIFFLLFVRWDKGMALRAFGLFVAIGLSYLGWILPFLNAVLVTNPGGIEYAMQSTPDTLLRIFRTLAMQPREITGLLLLTAVLLPVGALVGVDTRTTPRLRRLFGTDASWRKGYPLVIGLAVVLLAFSINAFVANLTMRSLVLLVPFGALVAAFGFVALPRAAQVAVLVFLLPQAFIFVDQEYPGPQDEVAAYIAPSYQPGSPIIINIPYIPRHIAVLYYVMERMGTRVEPELVWQVIARNQPYLDFMPFDPVHLIHHEGHLNALRDALDAGDYPQVWLINRYGGSALDEHILMILARHYEPYAHREWENEYSVIEFRRR
jgi:uncharacterized membrane protein